MVASPDVDADADADAPQSCAIYRKMRGFITLCAHDLLHASRAAPCVTSADYKHDITVAGKDDAAMPRRRDADKEARKAEPTPGR